MKTLLTFTLALGLLTPPAFAQKKPDTAKEKPAATEAKKADRKKEGAADKKKEAKPGELSASDKELVASAKKESDALTPAQQTKLMDLLNKGDTKALEAVEGIGEVRAKAIIAKRPFAKAGDAKMVDGIGIEMFKNLGAAAKGETKPAKTAKTEKPAAEKPKEEEKPKTTNPATKKP